MRLLIDTNIFLEVILDQEKAGDAKSLLTRNEEHDFFITDFSLHSIGLLLFGRKQHDAFRQFLIDMIQKAGMRIINLSTGDMELLIKSAERFSLDFDDAYQYAISEKYDLTMVSFDSDFDRTRRGRKRPVDFL